MFPFIAAAVLAPRPAKFLLTVQSIMRGPALVGHAPRDLRWSEDGTQLRFSWAKADSTPDPAYKDYVVRSDGTGLAPAGERTQIERIPPFADHSGTKTVYSSSGDLYIFDSAKKAIRRLTATQEAENDPRFIDGGKAVAYEAGGNLFRVDLVDGAVAQLTDIAPEPAKSSPEPPKNPSQIKLAEEDAKLFKGAPQERHGRFRGGDRGGHEDGPYAVRIPTGFNAGNLSISPSGLSATLELEEEPKGVRTAQVPNYVTRSGYTEDIPTYEKVGDRQPQEKVLILDLKNRKTIELALPRAGVVGSVRWAPNGNRVAMYAYAEDHKDDWILGYDAGTGKTSTLWDEHDNAWVGGPGRGLLGWLPDSSRVYFESEKTGFAHLMTMAPDGTDAHAITEGPFEVSDVRIDADRRRFTFASSEGSPLRRHLDAVSFEGGLRQKLADVSADDDAGYLISPNGRGFAIVRSTVNRPPELFVNGVQVTHTPTNEWLAGPWIAPPVVMIKARDGVEVPAHLYQPPHWHRGGPAVVFVHGAGYLQNVYDGWSYYYREYMFHHLLMSMGYVVLDLDYRGSAGYGKAWRTAIYRHMGGKDLDDEVDGAQWLVSELGVSPKRIGVYGGSYGGFITLMAMFTTPGTFAAGAALRPVCDWANYNHGYTSEILNLPQDDTEAYEKSSPIYFAQGLRGSLLICHGMVDTNVHFQDTVRLVERLIELGKPNWEVAPYPVENHSFTRPESWTDEYRRILGLFERTIGSGYRR